MSRAIFLKTLRDYYGLLLLLCAAMIGFEIVYIHAVDDIPMETGQGILKVPFIRDFLKFLLGGDILENLNPTGLTAMGFGITFVHACVWMFLVTVTTWLVAGEIDRGTADLLLALPLSRATIYISNTLAWLLMAIPLTLAPYCGAWIGVATGKLSGPVDFGRIALLIPNLYGLCLAIGGVGMCFSALMPRRGTAIGGTIAVLMLSFVINFLSQIWKFAKNFEFLGLLYYYRPLHVVPEGKLPWNDIGVLVEIFAVAWIIGLVAFLRKDIHAT